MEKLPLPSSQFHPIITLPCNKSTGRRTSSCVFFSYILSAPSLTIDAETFRRVSEKCNIIPLHRCIFTDQLTPVMAYRSLVKEEDRESPSFLFDSFGQGYQASNVGRYSAVGHRPVMEILVKENLVTIMDHEEGKRSEEFVDDPMVVPQRIMKGWVPLQFNELPCFFTGRLDDEGFMSTHRNGMWKLIKVSLVGKMRKK